MKRRKGAWLQIGFQAGRFYYGPPDFHPHYIWCVVIHIPGITWIWESKDKPWILVRKASESMHNFEEGNDD